MKKTKGKLFIHCSGPHCKNDIEVNEENLSVCADTDDTYFGISGKCPNANCNFENLVRGDNFVSSNVKICCPECDNKQAVTGLDREKPNRRCLTFETRCNGCEKNVEVNWDF